MPIMPRMDGTIPSIRPDLHVFYVFDTSGSMKNKPIGVLNRAMDMTVNTLRQVAAQNIDAKIKIAVLSFDSACHWLNPAGPEPLENFVWQDLFTAGKREVGAALRELDSKLSRSAFLDSTTSTLPPVIIFVTNGFATDDYEKELGHILHNQWFAQATRVGFAIGSNPDTQMVAKLAGSAEAVIRTNDFGVFARLLCSVSVSAITMAGNSHTRNSMVSVWANIMTDLGMSGVAENDVSVGFAYEETLKVFDPLSSGDSINWIDDGYDDLIDWPYPSGVRGFDERIGS